MVLGGLNRCPLSAMAMAAWDSVQGRQPGPWASMTAMQAWDGETNAYQCSAIAGSPPRRCHRRLHQADNASPPAPISSAACCVCSARAVWSADPARSRQRTGFFAGKARTQWGRTPKPAARRHLVCPIAALPLLLGKPGLPGTVMAAIGNFADPNFPAPIIAVWERSLRHPWVSLPPGAGPKRVAKQG